MSLTHPMPETNSPVMPSQVVEDAAAEYLTYFAGKVVGMIRAPDEYIYPPPFNIIEIFLIAPFE